MSETPAPESTTASPQKRPISTEATIPAKRIKQEQEGETPIAETAPEASSNPTMDEILQDDFDMDSFTMPDDLPGADGSLLQVPQFPQSSEVSSVQGTPQQLSLELPELISETAPVSTPSDITVQPQSQPLPMSTNGSTPAASSAAATPSIPQQQIPTQQPTTQAPATDIKTDIAEAIPAPPSSNGATSSANGAGNGGASGAAVPNANGGDDAKPTGPADPDKLSDALLSAGVDLKAEEALLNSSATSRPAQLQTGDSATANQPIIINTPFLDPRQVAMFMNKVVAAHGLKPNAESDPSLIQLMTYASEEWMKNILTNAIVLSRHRRRSIKNKRRSEMTVALRDIAMNNKSLEDNRAARKKDRGLDEKENNTNSEANQHKATNATLAMMTGNKKKKYDWMSAGSAGNKNSASDVSLRFREAREEPGLVVRDLLNSLEKKRVGVEKTLAKGYAKLKD